MQRQLMLAIVTVALSVCPATASAQRQYMGWVEGDTAGAYLAVHASRRGVELLKPIPVQGDCTRRAEWRYEYSPDGRTMIATAMPRVCEAWSVFNLTVSGARRLAAAIDTLQREQNLNDPRERVVDRDEGMAYEFRYTISSQSAQRETHQLEMGSPSRSSVVFSVGSHGRSRFVTLATLLREAAQRSEEMSAAPPPP